MRLATMLDNEAKIAVHTTENDQDNPLTDAQQRVYEVIREDGPIMGTAICNRTGLSQSSLTSHVIPVLKERKGVKNRSGSGYYLPDNGP